MIVISESEMQEIRKQINFNERDVGELKNRVTKSELLVERTLTMIEKFEGTMCTFSLTLSEMQIALLKISQSLENTNNETSKLSSKVDKLSDKVDLVEDANKFDIMQYLVKNFPAILLFVGGLVWYYSTVN